MSEYPGFIGPAYTLRSANAAQDRCVNLYPSKVEFGGKTGYELRGTPGLQLFATLPKSPGRGLWGGENRLFAVGDDTLYEVTSGTPVSIGTMNSASTPARIFSNGRQLMIVSGSQVWVATGTSVVRPSYGTLTGVVDTSGTAVTWVSGDKFPQTIVGSTITINAVSYTVASWISETSIVLTASAGAQSLVAWSYTENVNGVAGAYIGTYFAVLAPNSNTINVSASFDGLTWNALDFGDRTTRPDRFQMIYTVGSNLWLFGTQTSEVWALDSTDFPLTLIPGSVIDYGIYAPFSVAGVGDSAVMWLSGSDRGIGSVLLARGVGAGAVQRVSTDAIENEIQGYFVGNDAVAYSYSKYGHTFYVLTFPTAGKTWVYDLTTELWHERSYLSGGVTPTAQPQRFHAMLFRENMVQAGNSGRIWQMREDVYEDDGVPIERIRQAPHLSNEQEWTFYDRFQLDANVGQGSVSNPTVTLAISNDGGNTFPLTITNTLGPTADYKWRAIWNRLGRSRDRVFRLATRAANPVSWVGAYLKIRRGTGA